METLFGFRIKFFNYETLLLLYKEIFLDEQYHFCSSSKYPVILDCGSNIGMAIIYFKIVFPQCKIVGFEPNKEIFKLLKENVENNNLTSVLLHNRAIYNCEGRLPLYSNHERPGTLTMSLRPGQSNTVIGQIDTVLLSDFIDEEVDFLKLDVEGAEYLVIDELAKKDKLSLIHEMIVEYHHHLSHDDDSLSAFLRLLEDNGLGYQISTELVPPFNKNRFQDMLIYAYHASGRPSL